jgi:hypothetical protein
VNDNLPDVREFATEKLRCDGSAWVRRVLTRSAVDFLIPDARLQSAPGRSCGSNRGAHQVERAEAQMTESEQLTDTDEQAELEGEHPLLHCQTCVGEGYVVHRFSGGSVAYAPECIGCPRLGGAA